MDNHEYQRTQNMIMMVGQSISDLDLNEFLKRIHTAEVTTPIFNPTLYIEAANNLQKIKELAERLKHFQDLVKELSR